MLEKVNIEIRQRPQWYFNQMEEHSEDTNSSGQNGTFKTKLTWSVVNELGKNPQKTVNNEEQFLDQNWAVKSLINV